MTTSGAIPPWSTDDRTCRAVAAGEGGAPPIARPIENKEVYVLDAFHQPVPIGVTGEICIGGRGLARGYVNQLQSTAERFVPHPFGDRPGARLYRTGDLGRIQADGRLEFRGRVDHQLKIRGVRVELGEVEAVLARHPAVREVVALARADETGEKRLSAYVTPSEREDARKQRTHVSHWRALHDDIYRQGSPGADPKLNFVGWNSSYTGQPLPEEEMRDWVAQITERILSLHPRRVLEIGCGTGMLLFRIAPHCESYEGWDFSATALAHIRKILASGVSLPGVRLEGRLADDFCGIEKGSFDAVILNSVVQYFPSVDYLLGVLAQAVSVVAPGGFIYVGDLRSLPLLEAYAASVQLHQAPDELTREELGRRVRRQVSQEEELALDPRFFHALRERFPAIRRTGVVPKGGRYVNELTRFRYDVVLHVGAASTTGVEVEWRDWTREHLDASSLRQWLREGRSEALGVRGIPNAHLSVESQTMAWLGAKDGPATVGAFRSTLTNQGIEPDSLRSLGEELGYRVGIDWSSHGADGSFDVLFSRSELFGPSGPPAEPPSHSFGEPRRSPKGGGGRNRVAPGASRSLQPSRRRGAPKGRGAGVEPRVTNRRGERRLRLNGHEGPSIDLASFANDPGRAVLARRMTVQLRRHVRESLPEPMVPESVVVLDALPLTPNGKVDRNALPEPDWGKSNPSAAYAAPRTALQRELAELWREVLGTSRPVGLHDSFFELGGHSLLGIQLLSRVSSCFEVELPMRALFEAPTVFALAERIAQGTAGGRAGSPVVPIQPGGSNRPFFCVAPASGTVFPYYKLASLLGPEQPFYGLEDPRLGTPPAQLDGVEELAAHYLEGLGDVQERGPYLLGGWCFGGLVAFEMARQLAGAGEKVALLALFDCSIIRPRTKLSELPRELAFALSQAWDSLPFIRDNLFIRAFRARSRGGNGASRPSLGGSIRRRAAERVYRELLERTDVSHLTSSAAQLARMDLPAARRVLAMFPVTGRDNARYVVRAYPGRVTLFRALSGLTAEDQGTDLSQGWGAYSEGGVEVHRTPGNHISMFTSPHVQALARTLKTCLASAQQSPRNP